MARKKIVPEEEVSKPAMEEGTTAANVDDAAPADLMLAAIQKKVSLRKQLPQRLRLRASTEMMPKAQRRRRSREVFLQRRPRRKQCQ